jgi:hypothetical protein
MSSDQVAILPMRVTEGHGKKKCPCTAREIPLNAAAGHALAMVATVSVPYWSKAYSVPNRKTRREGLPSMALGAGPGNRVALRAVSASLITEEGS